jgi:hypothetical protein
VFILVLLDRYRGLLVGRVALDCALVLADCTPSWEKLTTQTRIARIREHLR